LGIIAIIETVTVLHHQLLQFLFKKTFLALATENLVLAYVG